MKHTDLAYAAALVDTLGVLTLREVGPTQLPAVAINTAVHGEALAWLGAQTGTKITKTARDYHRGACAQHCPDTHIHIVSRSGRWDITGVKATIVLHNLLPYLKVQRAAAIDLIAAGRSVGYKGHALEDMRARGWDIPNLKQQPRMRTPQERKRGA